MIKRALILFLVSLPAFAQIAKINDVVVTAPGGILGTSSAQNTTGATILIGVYTDGDTNANPTCQDGKGNAWHYRTLYTTTVSAVIICYAWDHGGTPLSVGAGETFSVQGPISGSYPVAVFLTFSGTQIASDPYDTENGNAPGGMQANISTGSISPGSSGELLISGFEFNTNTSTVTVNSGFTITDQVPFSSGNNYAGAAAYLINSGTTAQNPNWALGSGSDVLATAIAAFKAAPVVTTGTTISGAAMSGAIIK